MGRGQGAAAGAGGAQGRGRGGREGWNAQGRGREGRGCPPGWSLQVNLRLPGAPAAAHRTRSEDDTGRAGWGGGYYPLDTASSLEDTIVLILFGYGHEGGPLS